MLACRQCVKKTMVFYFLKYAKIKRIKTYKQKKSGKVATVPHLQNHMKTQI